MGLLTSLVTQVAQSAIQSKMGQSKMGGQSQADMGGLGNIFGNVLGGGGHSSHKCSQTVLVWMISSVWQ